MKFLTLLLVTVFIFSNPVYAAKKYLLDGEWVLNKQTNCEDPILQLTIKKNRIKAGKLKGKVNIKKNSLKLGKDLTGTFSSNSFFELVSKTSECIYEFTKERYAIPGATEGWTAFKMDDGSMYDKRFAGWQGAMSEEYINDVRLSKDNEPVRAGNKSIRFLIERGHAPKWASRQGHDMVFLDDGNPDRQEELLDTLDVLHGKDFWYFFSVFIPEDFPDPYDEEKMKGNSNWSEEIAVLRGEFYLIEISATTQQCIGDADNFPLATAKFYNGSLEFSYFPNIAMGKKIMSIDDMRGKWTDILIHINYDLEDGLMIFYVNGEKVYGKDLSEDYYDRNRAEDGYWNEVFEPDNYFFEMPEDFWDEGDSSVDECDYLIFTSFGGRRSYLNGMIVAKDIPSSVLYYDEVRIGTTREEVDIRSNPDLIPLN